MNSIVDHFMGFGRKRLPALAFVLSAVFIQAGGGPARAEPAVSQATKPNSADPEAKRFATDEPLRKGMMQIRALVEQHHSLVTHRRLSPDMAARFASELHNITEFIVGNSSLPSDASNAVASLVTKINDGADAIGGGKPEVEPIDGLFRIDDAMAEYGRQFEHPYWKADTAK